MEEQFIAKYENLNILTLETVYEFNRSAHERVPEEIQTRNMMLLRLIIKKYFTDKKAFPLYKRLRTWFDGWDLRLNQDTIGLVFSVIQNELQGDDLPREYLVDFIQFFMSGIDYVEKNLKDMNGSIDWDFSRYPQLYVYLSMIKDGDVDSVSLRARINELSSKLTEHREEQRTEGKNTSNLPALAGARLSAYRFQPLKLKKSRMNKGTLGEAMRVFGKYSAVDQEWLMAQVKKKGWDDLYEQVPTADMFTYLRTHTDLNLWSYIGGYNNWDSKGPSGSHYIRFTAVTKELTGYSDKDCIDMTVARKAYHDLYMSYPGGTEEGFSAYWSLIGGREYPESLRPQAVAEMKAVQFPVCGIMDILQPVSFVRTGFCTEPPVLVNVNGVLTIRENLKEATITGKRVDLYYEIYEKYSSLFAARYQMGAKQSLSARNTEEQDPDVLAFLLSPGNVDFTAGTLMQAIETHEEQKVTFDGMVMILIGGSEKKYLRTFIREAFCSGHKCIDKKLAEELFYNRERCESFLNYVSESMAGSGWFRKREDYMNYFYDVLAADWNFGTRDGFQHLLRFDFRFKDSVCRLLQKLGPENPRLAAIVEELVDDSRTSYCNISKILKAAYEDDYFFAGCLPESNGQLFEKI